MKACVCVCVCVCACVCVRARACNVLSTFSVQRTVLRDGLKVCVSEFMTIQLALCAWYIDPDLTSPIGGVIHTYGRLMFSSADNIVTFQYSNSIFSLNICHQKYCHWW